MNKTLKIKGILKDNFLKIKFMIRNPMIGEREAERRQLKQDYVTYIVIKVGTRILFELKPSANFSANPLVKFKVKQKEIKMGDTLEVEWKTLLSGPEHHSVEIHEVFSSVSKKS